MPVEHNIVTNDSELDVVFLDVLESLVDLGEVSICGIDCLANWQALLNERFDAHEAKGETTDSWNELVLECSCVPRFFEEIACLVKLKSRVVGNLDACE